MKKKWLAALGIFASHAAAPVKLIVNGQEIKADVTPQIMAEKRAEKFW